MSTIRSGIETFSFFGGVTLLRGMGGWVAWSRESGAMATALRRHVFAGGVALQLDLGCWGAMATALRSHAFAANQTERSPGDRCPATLACSPCFAM